MTMRIGVAALAAGLVLGGALAPAQTTTGTLIEPEALASPEALSLGDEQEAVLRDYIRRRPVERIVAIPGSPVRPGRVMPRAIRLSPLAHIPVEGLNRYAYVVSPDDKIVLVDPTTRRVVHVMDR
jgi:hypothetical protein